MCDCDLETFLVLGRLVSLLRSLLCAHRPHALYTVLVLVLPPHPRIAPISHLRHILLFSLA